MKTLKFRDHIIKEIEAGKRQVTWRLNDDKDIKIGDVIAVISGESFDTSGHIIVDSVTTKKYSDISDEDRKYFSGYDSMEQLHESMREYYGNSTMDDSVVKIIEFTYSPTPVEQPKNQLTTDAIIYSDGGSRGNPGPSASGYVVLDTEENTISQGGDYLGITTNNQAEYHSLLAAIKDAKKRGAKNITSYMDSLLVVNQINGTFKVRHKDLWPLYEAIKEEIKDLDTFKISHVPRAQNGAADAEVNKILDSVKDSE